MSFSGWKNVNPGEEFSIDEIAAHYGILGPYYLLEAPSFTRWGRYPLMVRAVAKDGVENLFAPGEKVRVFMRPMPGENGVADYDLKAFPENIFDTEETLRRKMAKSSRPGPCLMSDAPYFFYISGAG